MQSTAQENSASGHSMNEFLSFTLGKEEYGIEILKVQEIRGYDAVTAIANTPEFIKGVINPPASRVGGRRWPGVARRQTPGGP